MKHTMPLGALMAALSCSLSAQVIVAPVTVTGSNTIQPRSNAFRSQSLYDETHFTDQGIAHPISIHRLRYRAANAIVDPGGQVYPSVTVTLSTSPQDHTTMDGTFANNIGVDAVQVFAGSATTLATSGTSPNDDYIDITLTTPFVYNPEAGQDLCIDLHIATPPSAATPNPAAASVLAVHKVRRLNNNNPNAATGELSPRAPVAKLDYTILFGTALIREYGVGCNPPTPLTLSVDARPLLGTTINLQAGDIPAGAVLTGIILGLGSFEPGLPLDSLGMPGCSQYVTIDAVIGSGFTNPNFAVPFAISSDPGFLNMPIFGQAASLVPGANTLGALTSNGVHLTLGNL